MGNVLADLVPLIIGAAAVPVWIMIVLLMLRSDNGVSVAAAFVGGATLMRLVQGVLFGYVLGSSGEGDGRISSLLLLLMGILLWITAIKKWRKEDDPDGPPPKWMSSIDGMSPLRAFGVGALLVAVAPKMWVFTLSAISLVQDAALGPAMGALAYLLFTVGAVIILLILILVAALAPQKSAALLGKVSGWLERNERALLIVVSVVFGAFFTWKGLTRFIG
ncbi:MAG: GAP family protein [Chloroflexota bacterium]|nr:GAP family protein [Chloroflexota bacterium]